MGFGAQHCLKPSSYKMLRGTHKYITYQSTAAVLVVLMTQIIPGINLYVALLYRTVACNSNGYPRIDNLTQ